MKIFNQDLKKKVGVKAASYSIIRKWHFDSKPKKKGGGKKPMSQMDVQRALTTRAMCLLWPSL